MARRARIPRRPSAPLAALAAIALATVAAFLAGLLDPVSLAITVGGALGVARATFSARRIAAAWRRVVAALDEPPDEVAEAQVDDLVACVKHLARVHRIEGPPGLERELEAAQPELVRAAGRHLLECADGDELAAHLAGELRREEGAGDAAWQVVVTLGKLFPAFGLIGTLIGLAQMLPRLAGEDLGGVAPALGIAVLTTLYGAVLANAVVLPIATKLQSSCARRLLLMRLVATGMELVQRREYPTRVERAMRAFAGRTRSAGGDLILLHERAA